MKRLERLTALLSFLQSKRFIQLEDIIQKFQISERTAFRDLKALEETGVPVSFEKEKGYFILDRHFLGPLAFTIEEAKSFIFVEQLAKKYIDQTTYQNFNSALEKIKNKLRDHQLADFEALESKVNVYINPEYNNKYLHIVEHACAEKQVLELWYQDIKGKQTQRLIDPIGITFYSQSWHLIAYCRLREDYRDFSLLRILDIRPTSKTFNDPHLSLTEYIKRLEET